MKTIHMYTLTAEHAKRKLHLAFFNVIVGYENVILLHLYLCKKI